MSENSFKPVKSVRDHQWILTRVLLYVLTASAWIYLSDDFMSQFFFNTENLVRISMFKGLLFVAVTGLLLYLLLHRQRKLLLQVHYLQQENLDKIHALELLTAIAHTTDEAIFAEDLDCRFIFFNRAAERILNVSADEVLGKDETSVFPEEFAQYNMAENRHILETGEGLAVEQPIPSATGIRYFLTNKQPLRNTEGEVIGLFGIAHDISDRKQAENNLRKRLDLQDQLSRIAASVPGGIFSFKRRPDGTYCMPFSTPAVEELYGVSQSGMKQNLDELMAHIHPDDIEQLVQSIEQAAQEYKPWNSEYRYYHPVKGLRWLEGWSIPRRVPDGSIEWHGFVMDITSRKQAVEARQQSEVRYQKLVDNLREIVFQTDAEGRWTFLNPAWTEVTGFSIEESIGKPFLDYVYPDDREKNQEQFEPLIQRQKDYCQHEIRYRHRDGGYVWIEVHARLLLDASDQIQGTAGTLTDITTRKNAVEALQQQTEALRQHNEELERFNRVSVGREMKMIELKQEINQMARELGREPPYELSFANSEDRDEGL